VVEACSAAPIPRECISAPGVMALRVGAELRWCARAELSAPAVAPLLTLRCFSSSMGCGEPDVDTDTDTDADVEAPSSASSEVVSTRRPTIGMAPSPLDGGLPAAGAIATGDEEVTARGAAEEGEEEEEEVVVVVVAVVVVMVVVAAVVDDRVSA
jgi:hypothetical protein